MDPDTAGEPSPPRQHEALRLPTSCSKIPKLDNREARAFDYFLHKVAPVLGGELDAQFWRILLPRISHGDSSVRYAVLAISQLYENSVNISDQASYSDKSQSLHLQWHNRSLSEFRSQMSNLCHQDDYVLALLSCVLLTNIECQQNNPTNACNLLRRGNALIVCMRQSHRDDSDWSRNPRTTIARMLMRQRVLMAIFGHCTLEERSNPASNLPKRLKSPLETLTEARHCLSSRLFETLQLVRAATSDELRCIPGIAEELSSRKVALLRRLELWYQNFSEIQRSRQKQPSPAEDVAAKVLIVHYETALVWASTSLQPDSAFDIYTDRFEKIVQLAAEITYARRNEDLSSIIYLFEMGMVAPLYWTGWKCKHPAIRRRALSLIHQGPKQEALFSADLHARALEKIIEIEEGSVMQSTHYDAECETGPMNTPCRIRKATVHYETWAGEKVRPMLIYDRTICDADDGSTLPMESVPLWDKATLE